MPGSAIGHRADRLRPLPAYQPSCRRRRRGARRAGTGRRQAAQVQLGRLQQLGGLAQASGSSCQCHALCCSRNRASGFMQSAGVPPAGFMRCAFFRPTFLQFLQGVPNPADRTCPAKPPAGNCLAAAHSCPLQRLPHSVGHDEASSVRCWRLDADPHVRQVRASRSIKLQCRLLVGLASMSMSRANRAHACPVPLQPAAGTSVAGRPSGAARQASDGRRAKGTGPRRWRSAVSQLVMKVAAAQQSIVAMETGYKSGWACLQTSPAEYQVASRCILGRPAQPVTPVGLCLIRGKLT